MSPKNESLLAAAVLSGVVAGLQTAHYDVLAGYAAMVGSALVVALAVHSHGSTWGAALLAAGQTIAKGSGIAPGVLVQTETESLTPTKK